VNGPHAREELLQTVREKLFTAVVGDVIDKMGLLHQFLPPRIRPMGDDTIVLGRAMTVLEADVFAEEPGPNASDPMTRPFGLMLRALDDLKPGEVYLCSGASPRYALWGSAHDFGQLVEIVLGWDESTCYPSPCHQSPKRQAG